MIDFADAFTRGFTPLPELGIRLELESVDPAQKRKRYYALAVVEDRQLPLFGETTGLLLVVVRGRIGHKSIVVWEPFPGLRELTRRWGALLDERRKHRYRLTQVCA